VGQLEADEACDKGIPIKVGRGIGTWMGDFLARER